MIIVTRHPALVQYLVEEGIVPSSTPVVAHADAESVRGQHVYGVLPLHLAAEAASVTEVPLNLSPEDRGHELSIDRMRQVARRPRTYRVMREDQAREAARIIDMDSFPGLGAAALGLDD